MGRESRVRICKLPLSFIDDSLHVLFVLKHEYCVKRSLYFLLNQVKNRGVSIFLMEAGMVGTLQALWVSSPYLQILDGVRTLILDFSRSTWGLPSHNALNLG